MYNVEKINSKSLNFAYFRSLCFNLDKLKHSRKMIRMYFLLLVQPPHVTEITIPFRRIHCDFVLYENWEKHKIK